MVRRTFFLVLLIVGTSLSAGAQSLTPQWTFTARGPFIGSAATANGFVYAGSLDSTLYALDLTTGAVRWTFRAAGPVRSTPCVDGSVLYLNAGGALTALDAASGAVRWRFATKGEKIYTPYGYADYYQSSPVVRDGTVYFGSGDGHLYAVNAKNGALRWKFNTGDVVHASPVLDSARVYIGAFNGVMYALEKSTGKEVWRFKTVGHRFFPKGEVQGTAALSDGLVTVGARDYNIYALDAAKGYAHWNRTFPRGWALSLTADDTALYTGTSDDDVIVAFEAGTGTELWRTDLRFNTFGRAALDDSLLYIGTLLGQVHALDRRTGRIAATFLTEGFRNNHARFFSHPDSISKARFYSIVQSPEGYIEGLYALGAIFSDVLRTGSSLIVTSTDGRVYCLDKNENK
ncbi:MAG: PQQ-binding-like beta-propeller repeat protein [Bacteroidetes bacterium]|nr:MAG: PQQ-binding-like beta-propeller repeat protein [Bacteroidota bacterium]